MRRGALVLATALILACESSSAPAPPSSPTAPGGLPGPVATRSAPPEPSPLASARSGIAANKLGAIPALFRYVALDAPLADGVHTRLWLVDLGAKRAPAVAAEWDAPATPVGGWSASADGRTLIVTAQGTRSRVALSLVRPETGEIRTLFEDPAITVVSAYVSPDGSRFAFTKYPAAGGSDLGIWTGRTSGGEIGPLTAPSTDTTAPQMPLGWSIDAAWLAFTREGSDPAVSPELRLIRTSGGAELPVGPGDRVAWHTGEPQLLVAASGPNASRLYVVDLSRATPLASEIAVESKAVIPAISWHPTLPRLAYAVSDNAGRESSRGIWLKQLPDPLTGVGSGLRRLDQGTPYLAPEWSPDGTILSALAGGDDVRIPIVDLLTGRQLSVLCRRGGTPPANCV